jgi:hypothetical protein
MNWKKGILFGVVVWAIMFVIACIFVAYKVPSNSTFFNIVLTVLSAIAILIVAGFVAPKNAGQALGYGILFAVVGIILDFLISSKFAPGMFRSSYYWLSYILVIILPLFRVKRIPKVIRGPEPTPQ